MAQDAQFVLLMQYAGNQLASTVCIASDAYSDAGAIVMFAQCDVDDALHIGAALHHLGIVTYLDAFYLTSLEMVEQGGIVETILLIVDAEGVLAVEVSKRITAQDVVAIKSDEVWA